MSVQIRKTGFNFAALSERTKRNIAGALNGGCESGVSLGQQLAPVLTGFLRDNIEQTEIATPTNLRAAYESAADYSVFVNFGTIYQEANPYFSVSFESARRQVNNDLLRVLR